MNLAVYFFNLFRIWIETMFIVPFQNLEMLWLLVPVWLAWFFAEFFQEKVGTSMGNAITNAVVILWGSIDCTRQTVTLITKKALHSTFEIIGRFSIVLALFVYGVVIVHLGFKGNKIIKKIGRVRIVTYIFAMFVPVIYNAIPFSVEHFLACVIFFPLFYFVIELIDHVVPDPKALREDIKDMSVLDNRYEISNGPTLTPIGKYYTHHMSSPLTPMHPHTSHLNAPHPSHHNLRHNNGAFGNLQERR